MSVNFGPQTALLIVLSCLPMIPFWRVDHDDHCGVYAELS